ncbi:MAG: hypothetical protein ACTSXX_12400 [Candidatus Baldrarchaeia archaeon]
MQTPKELYLAQIKGRIGSYVERESEPLSKLVRYIRTMCERRGINWEDIRKILKEVWEERVKRYLDPSRGVFYQPKRRERFESLCRELSIKFEF